MTTLPLGNIRRYSTHVDRPSLKVVFTAMSFAVLGFFAHEGLYGGLFGASSASSAAMQSQQHQQHQPPLASQQEQLQQQHQLLLRQHEQMLHLLEENRKALKPVVAPLQSPCPSAMATTTPQFETARMNPTESNDSGACGTTTDWQLRDAVRAAVSARRTYPVTGGPPFTQTAIMNVHPCVRASSRHWSVRKDVLFVVMAGTVLRDRVRAIWDTWGRGLQDTGNMIIMSDGEDAELRMITLPELQGRSQQSEGSHRSLRGLQYAMSQPRYANFSWIALVDDDAWVNVRELPSFLYGWNPAAPLMFGFFWNSPWFKRESSWPSGPFMLLSRSAAEIMAPRLYTQDCPFDRINDVTLGACAWSSGVASVHTPLVDPEGVHFLTDKTYMKMSDNDGDIRTLLAIHRMQPDLMRAVQAIVDRYPADWRLAEAEKPGAVNVSYVEPSSSPSPSLLPSASPSLLPSASPSLLPLASPSSGQLALLGPSPLAHAFR